MNLNIELISEDALHQLKEMEAKRAIRLLSIDENGFSESKAPIYLLMKNLISDDERMIIIKSLWGAIPYDKKSYKAQLKFIREGRGHRI